MQPLNRRGFLQSGIAAASALAVDPERLLWTPGAKTIFIPPPPKVVAGGGFNVTLLAGEKYYQTTDGRVLKVDPDPNRKLHFSQLDTKRFIITGVGDSDGVFFIRTVHGLYLKNTKSQTALVRVGPDGSVEVTRTTE